MNTNNDVQRLALCLSGGGFRASFYHIGVLARMAELGLLKHVEVISTVSGGSIVGVAYYMKLKALLEKYSDSEIKDQQYVDMVKELEDQFLFAVQKNLRMRTFANPFKNMFMALPSYSRSDAIGEIYEKYIYRYILDDKKAEYRPVFKRSENYLSIRDLLIHPDADESFHPAEGNISRSHKVPILILNATCLNSGHNWYFSATSMGEVPPRNNNFHDIDKKDRYRRIRYDE
ncbi:MAG: patatin family protein, partial [Gammaproteobacteria bacterium]